MSCSHKANKYFKAVESCTLQTTIWWKQIFSGWVLNFIASGIHIMVCSVDLRLLLTRVNKMVPGIPSGCPVTVKHGLRVQVHILCAEMQWLESSGQPVFSVKDSALLLVF